MGHVEYYTCDNCGKNVGSKDNLYRIYSSISTIGMPPKDSYKASASIDICKDCVHDIGIKLPKEYGSIYGNYQVKELENKGTGITRCLKNYFRKDS